MARRHRLLTKGFETIPKKRILYKGRVLAEMDLDPFSREAPRSSWSTSLRTPMRPAAAIPSAIRMWKRFSRTYDVYSTLNVQHLESLSDVVAQITHVRVRETVPDFIVDRADDVELVDLTPDDLLQRLKKERSISATRDRAAQNYFAPGNLTALRELALRRTASASTHRWSITCMPTRSRDRGGGEHVLVCVDESPGAAALSATRAASPKSCVRPGRR